MAKTKNISLKQNEAILFYQEIFNQHHAEVTSLYRDGIRTGLGLIKLIFEQKDEAFEKTLSILHEISGKADSSKIEDYTEELKAINEEIKLLSEDYEKLKDEIRPIQYKINDLRSKFDAQEAVYHKIIELKMKKDLDSKTSKIERMQSLITSLELADEINKLEIDLIEKTRDETRLKAKLYLQNRLREKLEIKRYGEIRVIANSLDVVKAIARHNLEKAQKSNNQF